MRLADFSRNLLGEAVRIYLEEAYGGRPVPEAVRGRLAWPPGETLADLARDEAFERTPPDAPPVACQRIRLRLGNRVFPHMKLGIDRVSETEDWVLTVDTHDAAVMRLARAGDRAALESLLRTNAALKARIEHRWGEAGLPTFERYIRASLGGAPPSDRPGGGARGDGPQKA